MRDQSRLREVDLYDLVTTVTGERVPVQAGNVPGAVGIYRDGSFSIIARHCRRIAFTGTIGATGTLEQP